MAGVWPGVGGTNTKVKEIVLDEPAYGWSPKEMHFQHPHLSRLDDEIRRDLEEVDALRSQFESSRLRSKLQSIRKSP
jgi:hypothetical protein